MSEVVAMKKPRAGTRMRIGFLRLTDSAPAIVAGEFGYFAEEGVDLAGLQGEADMIVGQDAGEALGDVVYFKDRWHRRLLERIENRDWR